MRNVDEIIINKAFVAVLDRENNNLILPEHEFELTEDSYAYFERHILKVFKDDEAQAAKFDGEQNIIAGLCEGIFYDSDIFFIASSMKMSHYLYKCMGNDEKEPSGDFAVCLFEAQDGKYVALMKLNFTEAYTHYINTDDGKTGVALGMNRTGLPGLGQKVSKAAIIKATDCKGIYELLVTDKAKDGIFTKAFLNCSMVMDRRANTKLIRSVAERYARKEFKDNAAEAEAFRTRVNSTLVQEDSVNLQSLVEQSLPDATCKSEFMAALKCEGIQQDSVLIDREWAEKKLKRKRLKVDKSMELYIDAEAYNDRDKFVIKRNGDGTIDIILKNVRNYIEK